MVDRRTPLLDGRLRGPAVVTVLLAAAVLVTLGVHYAGRSTGGWLDDRLGPLAESTLDVGLLGVVERELSTLGNPFELTVLVSVLAVGALLVGRWDGALLAVGSVGLSALLTAVLLKPLFDRHDGEALAFPSTHAATTSSAALVLVVLLLGARRSRARVLCLVLACLALLTAVVSTVGVVARQTHYATDTLGGWCVALVGVLGCALLLDWLSPRLISSPPAAPR